MVGILGILFFLFVSFLLSKNRKNISYRLILGGIGIQVLLAVLILGIPALGVPGALTFLFHAANAFFIKILEFSDAGAAFLFGPLIDTEKIGGWIFAFRVLPTIIFFSALMSILYYLGIMQRVVNLLSVLMQKTFKISAAESLATSANVFVGQTEAPLVVKPYIKNMTQSELLVLMTGGMATVAGSVLAAFVSLLSERIPDIGGHLLTASVMSAPAAILIAKILLPETDTPKTLDGKINLSSEDEGENIIEAAAKGASEGLKLALNVAAMLLAFIALLALVNWSFYLFGDLIGFSTWGEKWVPEILRPDGEVKLSLELILSWFFAPIAFLMGIPWSEAHFVGSLLGKKIVLNEFVAYVDLANNLSGLSDKTIIISSYALCGFANFSSIGIQLGGIGGLAPTRRGDLAKLGLYSVYGGSLAAFLTATIAGLLI